LLQTLQEYSEFMYNFTQFDKNAITQKLKGDITEVAAASV
jgi:hypothetical protein